MTCHEWQEVILTEYIDGELTAERQDMLEAHLAECQACAEFSAAAKKAVVEPFDKAQGAQVPEHVWHRVKEAIDGDEQAETVGLWERFKEMIDLPKPAVAFATVIICLMAVTVTLKHYQKPYIMPSEAESIDYVLDELGTYDIENHFYEPTGIEEYFL